MGKISCMPPTFLTVTLHFTPLSTSTAPPSMSALCNSMEWWHRYRVRAVMPSCSTSQAVLCGRCPFPGS
uniref:Uncharacterized protein n=1 Tax=Ixodes scapularis TaxID=6945 RepID=A0A4D5RE95_IXOSC